MGYHAGSWAGPSATELEIQTLFGFNVVSHFSCLGPAVSRLTQWAVHLRNRRNLISHRTRAVNSPVSSYLLLRITATSTHVSIACTISITFCATTASAGAKATNKPTSRHCRRHRRMLVSWWRRGIASKRCVLDQRSTGLGFGV